MLANILRGRGNPARVEVAQHAPHPPAPAPADDGKLYVRIIIRVKIK